MPDQLDENFGKYSVAPKRDDSQNFDGALDSLNDKVKDLQEIVNEINGLIEERKLLGKEVCKEIEEELSRARQFLREFERPGGIRIGEERVRGVYEQELFELKSERRKEMIKEWEDIARLKKELREHGDRMNEVRRKLKDAKK